MTCQKVKTAYFFENDIYADKDKTALIPDATSDYSSSTGEGKGLVVQSEDGHPFFFQTDLNSSVLDVVDALIDAFTISALPTSAYETELDLNLKAAKVKLEEIRKIIP